MQLFTALAVIVSGVAIFVVPGGVLLVAARTTIAAGERLAWCFAGSLTLLTAAFAVCLALHTTIAAAPLALAIVTIVSALLLRALVAPDALPAIELAADDESAGRVTLFFDTLLWLLVAA